MRNLAYIIKFIKIDLENKIIIIIKRSMSLIGTVYTFVELLQKIKLFPQHNLTNIFSEYFFGFLLISIIAVLYHSLNWKTCYTYKVNDYDVKISLILSDILDEKGSVVISTNSSFITTMEQEFISIKSVQGAFQDKFFKNNLNELDRKIIEQLEGYRPTGKKIELNGIKFNQYEIGTTIKIQQDNRHVYFVALNDVNAKGQNETREKGDFYTALEGLWKYVSLNGHVEDVINIPIIATGRAGIATITKNEAIKDIVQNFIDYTINSGAKVTKHLRIVIFYHDLEDINLLEVKDFLEQKCKVTRKSDARRYGNPIE